MLGGLALIVAMSGVAVAAVPGADKTVTVCISKDGAIKAIDAEAGKTCQGSQTATKLATTDATGKVANTDLLDGQDSTAFLGANAKAADADKLDGKDSMDFLQATDVAWAVVRGSGESSVARSSAPGMRLIHRDTGLYFVELGQPVNGCAVTVSLVQVDEGVFRGPNPVPGQVAAQVAPNISFVQVQTADATGTPADRDFHVVANC